MAKRGISILSYQGKKITKICPFVDNPKFPMWVQTEPFDFNIEGVTTGNWRSLQANPECITDIIKKMSTSITLYPVDMLRINGNIIKVNELYLTNGKVYSIFRKVKNQSSKERNILSLLVVHNKTAHEMLKCGYTKRKESFAPLLIEVDEGKIKVLNSL